MAGLLHVLRLSWALLEAPCFQCQSELLCQNEPGCCARCRHGSAAERGAGRRSAAAGPQQGCRERPAPGRGLQSHLQAARAGGCLQNMKMGEQGQRYMLFARLAGKRPQHSLTP